MKHSLNKVTLNPSAQLIKGGICGYRIEEIETPLPIQASYLDKLVDGLAKGGKMGKTLRKAKIRPMKLRGIP
ncbi:DUF2200 family protein [Pelagihabitans pacificus]|uniref:DUF2200 family protein n=1 Tax=Pelagihabitans pacificus TaxID=2696054 RepID=UPI00293BCA80|nr:DUF2200 family protein [Pelagihabitans pacificus]